MNYVTQACPYVREASWFCRRQLWTETYAFQLKHRLHFWRMKKDEGQISAMQFIINIATMANDVEIFSEILQKPSLFDYIYDGKRR